MTRFSKRGVLLALTAVVVMSAAAAAYWTAGGSGTGSASTGTAASLTVVQTTVLTAMYPGDSPQTTSGTITNPNSGPVYVGTVTASIASVTKDVGAPAGTCDASDYTLASAAMAVNAQMPADDTGAWSGATLKFNNKAGSNQDACKGATVSLAYAIS